MEKRGLKPRFLFFLKESGGRTGLLNRPGWEG